MNFRHVSQFMHAVGRGDDAYALHLLDNGRVTIHSVYIHEADDRRISNPLIFLAVEAVREDVARALVHLGASIDMFRDVENGVGGSYTAAGDAILAGNAPALSLCLRLGANLSCVYRSVGSHPKSTSGLDLAIGSANHAALLVLLDERFTEKPVHLSGDETKALLILASHGSSAKLCYGILESRGFNFKALEEVKCEPFGEVPTVTSVADFLLAFAHKNGAADLMHYPVKDLGLVSTSGVIESLKDTVDTNYVAYGDSVSRPRDDLTNFKCAACQFVGATSFCSICKVPRYCSTECQRSHWKTGGHKKECKDIQRLMRSKEEGFSGAAGSSNS